MPINSKIRKTDHFLSLLYIHAYVCIHIYVCAYVHIQYLYRRIVLSPI